MIIMNYRFVVAGSELTAAVVQGSARVINLPKALHLTNDEVRLSVSLYMCEQACLGVSVCPCNYFKCEMNVLLHLSVTKKRQKAPF